MRLGGTDAIASMSMGDNICGCVINVFSNFQFNQTNILNSFQHKTTNLKIKLKLFFLKISKICPSKRIELLFFFVFFFKSQEEVPKAPGDVIAAAVAAADVAADVAAMKALRIS